MARLNGYVFVDSSTFPENAGDTRKLRAEEGSDRTLVVPIKRESRAHGLFRFSMPPTVESWYEQDLRVLRLVGELLVTAIERKLSERSLLQSEKRLRALADNMLDVVCQVDNDEILTFVSPSYTRVFGRAPHEAVGKSFSKFVHPNDRSSGIPMPGSTSSVHPAERGQCRYRHSDGYYLWLEIVASPLVDEQGASQGLMLGMRDITDRKNADEKIASSLREKEVLLKEIHHRVKNNLQVICSLLSLQSSYLTDAGTRELFAESQNRVRSMALIHEKLYQSDDFVAIDFAEYINGLAGYLYRSYATNPDHVRLIVDVVGTTLGMDAAVPCGLIINELLSNALKYAFPGDEQGTITIRLGTLPNGRHLLTVADDGVGIPADFDVRNTDSLGLQLVTTLTRQIDGELSVRSGGGTEFSIQFKGQQNA
jgi:PAS domain S-box-containing protein